MNIKEGAYNETTTPTGVIDLGSIKELVTIFIKRFQFSKNLKHFSASQLFKLVSVKVLITDLKLLEKTCFMGKPYQRKD